MKWIFKIIDCSNEEKTIRELYIFAESKAEAVNKIKKNYANSSIYSYQLFDGDEIFFKEKFR